MILNFCLIGKIQYNFLVPTIVESGRKTFIPIQIQTLNLSTLSVFDVINDDPFVTL